MTPDALTSFHPAVAGWFSGRFPTPTEAQNRAWAVTTQYRNALVVEGLTKGLPNDIHKNL